MLMVVFGAGASYDSDPDHPAARESERGGRPPLTAGLFAFSTLPYGPCVAQYPGCIAIADLLRQLPADVSIEQRLAMLQGEAEKYPHRHRQLAAVKFYLRELLWQDLCRLE